jgi:hypothetical protein
VRQTPPACNFLKIRRGYHFTCRISGPDISCHEDSREPTRTKRCKRLSCWRYFSTLLRTCSTSSVCAKVCTPFVDHPQSVIRICSYCNCQISLQREHAPARNSRAAPRERQPADGRKTGRCWCIKKTMRSKSLFTLSGTSAGLGYRGASRVIDTAWLSPPFTDKPNGQPPFETSLRWPLSQEDA